MRSGAIGPKALEWLETALRLRDPGLELLKTDPLLDPLRKEPRFQAIERELKFPIHKLRIHLRHFLGDEPVLQGTVRIRLQVKRDGSQLFELRAV